jgi:hypothetical protein
MDNGRAILLIYPAVLAVMAYEVLEAARGIRPISVERLRRIKIEWSEVEKFGLRDKVLCLRKRVESGE